MSLQTEINRRRTFAIISHPDAGKTTLTEKLLLFGGAIREAGAVKSNKIKKSATSDFMEIERQRGISVQTSVMGFNYRGIKINILDTPGHKDFAEDTFRTLTAADSVIVVIDVAKGVEEQTEKLVEVCRLRDIPIIVFINKLDRSGKDVFELLDEVEQKLNLKIKPLSWPIGMGRDFKGVYNIYDKSLKLFDPHQGNEESNIKRLDNLEDSELDEILTDKADVLREELELIEEVYPEFSTELYQKGQLSPLFWGSALNNFGVQELLNGFLDIAPPPQARTTNQREVKPAEEKFTGFVFKIHANIDPNHRKRVVFIKIVSGIFKRNYNYYHVRLQRNFKFSSPTAFMADKKEVVDEMYPGDIVGITDSGNFKIGDTLTEGENMSFLGIPNFSPELFRYIENADPMKSKQLEKGIRQLMDEGVAQLFIRNSNNRKIIGTVGELQFDVIQYRLEHEYGAKCRYEPLSLRKACWVETSNGAQLEELKKKKSNYMAKDRYGNDVFLSETDWALERVKDLFPEINFISQSESIQ